MAPHQAAQRTPTLTRVDLRLDAAIAAAAFATSLGLLAAGDRDLGDRAGDINLVGIVLTAFASLPLVARRRAPLVVFALTGLGSAALFAVAGPAGPPIGPTVALYTVAASSNESQIEPRLIFGVVAITFMAHLSATGLAIGSIPGTESVLGAAIWGGTWLAGERSRLRRERMAELEERASRAEREAQRERRLAVAEERMRIARDLHDSAAHAINVILIHAGHGRLQTDRDPACARAAFETIEDVARETVGEIDQLVRVLRDDNASGNGVEPPPGVAALDGLVERHRAAGLDVTATIRGERRAVPAAVERGAYRILQEALTNAARHGAGSARVHVVFAQSALELTVTNPLGRARVGRPEEGHGVIGMRERAALLGGSLQAGARDQHFEVHAHLPFVTSPA